MGDVIVIAVLVIVVALCIYSVKKNKVSCDGDCSHCGGCGKDKNKKK